jgi:hypothetical protein
MQKGQAMLGSLAVALSDAGCGEETACHYYIVDTLRGQHSPWSNYGLRRLCRWCLKPGQGVAYADQTASQARQ